MQQTGTLSVDGGTTEITFTRHLAATPEAVWELLATTVGVTRWLVQDSSMSDSVGASVRLVFGDGAEVTGTITERIPPTALAHGWDYGPDARSEVAWSLTPSDGGTRLGLVHRGLPEEQARGYLPGWHAYLERLEAVLTGAAPGEWEAMYAEAAALYDD